jgi:CRP-like cAMP-binding protein
MLRKNAKIELLKRVPLFAECSKAQLAEIALIADEIDIREGTVLISEGNPGREFCVVIEGTVEVSRGGKALPVRGGRKFFGEISLLTDSPTTATVVTTSPVRALVITARGFRRLLEKSPAIQGKVMSAMAARLAPETL